MPRTKAPWVVEFKTARLKAEFGDEWEDFGSDPDELINLELSVVVSGTHGHHSWGWPSHEKIILLGSTEYSDDFIEVMKVQATEMAARLNKQED